MVCVFDVQMHAILIKSYDACATMVPAFIELAQSYVYIISVSIVILLVGFALGILAKKLLLKVLRELEFNKLASRFGFTTDLERLISSTTAALIYLVTLIFFLNYLGIAPYILYLILGAVLTLIVLTFLVGVKDVIPNFVAWIILERKGVIRVGKQVEVREIEGTVERVGFLETEIRTARDDLLYVPNSLFLKSKFTIKK